MAQAQPRPSPDSTGQVLVSDVHFVGDDFFAEDVLQARVRTTHNRRFLGVGGFTWWLWIYRLGASGTFGKRIGQALMASGEAPALLDSSVVVADTERLRNFYQQEGFRQAQVFARVDTTHKGRKAVVTFEIHPGPPTFIRRVVYAGFEALDADRQVHLTRESLLRPRHIDPETPLRFEARRQRYSGSLLLEERGRILAFLRDEGFAAVTRDSIRAFITPYSLDSFDVTLRAHPGPRYRFGAVHFEVVGPEERFRPRVDTLVVDTTNGLITSQIQYESRLDPDLLARSLQFRPGDWYNQSQLLATKRRLEGTGVFSFTDIVSSPPDTLHTSLVAPRLPLRIEARTQQRHRIRFETFMVQRSGLLSGADNELGTGIGVSYENANLSGNGEIFRLSTTGSIAADVDSTLFTSAQAEVTTSLTLPYLITPFRGLDRRLNLYRARTRLSLSLLTARREDLRLVIRGRGAARMRLDMQHTPTVTSFVDLLDVSLSNPDTLGGFQQRFLDRILGIGDSLLVTDPVQRAQILEDYTQPQINNALRYTFRSATVNPLRRERGYSYEVSFEIGGNLPYLLDRFVFSPDSVEGSLPGLPFFRGDRLSNRLVYRQYVRFVGDLRRYQPLSRTTVFAWKLIGGIAHPTSRSEVVPFDRRFYSGGGSSVRGWRLRELGPGGASFRSVASDGATNILGGDIKLEASAELRHTFLRNTLAANWIFTLFADAGNVWFGPRNPGFRNLEQGAPSGQFLLRSFYKELGVGTGFGLRLAWEYLILRFDLAYRVYDPAVPGKGLFPNGLKDPTPYFGIGHAF
ncbi:MAG: BamA/TamA family outer membrane protein [Rhodothermales bacterium]